MRFTLLSAALMFFATCAQATEKTKVSGTDMAIAAVVGEEAISSYDVASRMKFVLATTRLSNTQEVLARVRPQVIRSLIDEQLQLGEAKKNAIEVNDAEIAQAIEGIEAQRGMRSGSIFRMLEQNAIPRDTFLQQIRAQLVWGKLVQKKLRPRIRVSDEEIEAMRKKLSIPKIKQELEIALMVLPVDKPSREAEIKKLADKFVQEVRGGANFEELSRQFSSHYAAGKIDRFWLRPEQLDPIVAKILEGATAGTITDPLRNSEGFTIIKVYDTRALSQQDDEALSVVLREIVLTLKADASEKEASVMLDIGKQVAKNPGKCEDKGVGGVENLDDFNIKVNQIKETMADLPDGLHAIASNLTLGGISPPFASREGIVLYMLCEKTNVAAANIDKDRISQMLVSQKLQLEAQKYLRNLRRENFIEIR